MIGGALCEVMEVMEIGVARNAIGTARPRGAPRNLGSK